MRLLILFLFLVILPVFSCGNNALRIEPYEKAKPILWVVGIDTTYDKEGNPPPKHFNNYPEIFKEYVLYHCKAGDEIRILLIDSDPIDDHMKKYSLEGNSLKVAKTAKDIYEYVKSIKQLPKNKGYTNIGAVLKYAKDIPQKKGETVVVVCITDGKPTGKQDTTNDSIGGMKVWFVGIEKEAFTSDLSRLAARMGFKEDQMTSVTYPYWEDGIDHFEKSVDRAKNPDIINHLENKKIVF